MGRSQSRFSIVYSWMVLVLCNPAHPLDATSAIARPEQARNVNMQNDLTVLHVPVASACKDYGIYGLDLKKG